MCALAQYTKKHLHQKTLGKGKLRQEELKLLLILTAYGWQKLDRQGVIVVAIQQAPLVLLVRIC